MLYFKKIVLLLLLSLFSLKVNANQIIKVLKVKEDRAILLLPDNFSINLNQNTLQLKDTLIVTIIKKRKNKVLVLLNTDEEIKVSDQFLVKNNVKSTELDLKNDSEKTIYQHVPFLSKDQLNEIEKTGKQEKEQEQNSKSNPNYKTSGFITLGKNISSNITAEIKSSSQTIKIYDKNTFTSPRLQFGIKTSKKSLFHGALISLSYQPFPNDRGSIIKIIFETPASLSESVNVLFLNGVNFWRYNWMPNFSSSASGILIGLGIEFFPTEKVSFSSTLSYDFFIKGNLNQYARIESERTAVYINGRFYF